MAVVDLKTSRQLSREHGLQTGGYALLAKDYGWKVDRRLVVRIKKEKPGLFFVRDFPDHKEDELTFRALVVYWHWAHKRMLLGFQQEQRGSEDATGDDN
jgi:hypothetical protein